MTQMRRRDFVKAVGAMAGELYGAQAARSAGGEFSPGDKDVQTSLPGPRASDEIPPIPVITCTRFEEEFKPAYLSNGVVGIRPGFNPLIQAQALVSGFVRTHPTLQVESLSPAPYPLWTDIKAHGQSLLASNSSSLSVKSQTLDMSTGELATEMTLVLRGELRLELKILQFVSRSVPSVLCQEILITSSSDVPIEIHAGIGREGLAGDVYFDRPPRPEPDPDLQVLGFRNGRNKLGIAVAAERGDPFKPRGEGVYVLAARAGQTYSFRTLASMVCEVYDPEPELQAVRVVGWARMVGFESLRRENAKEWSGLWKSRVKVYGGGAAQKALDAAFFYLHSSVHPSCRTGMPPYGLTQYEALEGHVFWDMDSWCLPPVLLASPAAAKAMLEYRLRGLHAARQRAELFGYRGAQFPWESGIAGYEECPTWIATGWAEQHVTPDVALAFWEYQMATGDAVFLTNGTWMVLKEVAEWIESRGEFTKKGFEILDVMGVDESLPKTNNNSYMNSVCKIVTQAAVECSRRVGIAPSAAWERIGKFVVIPLDKQGQIVVPFDGAETGPSYSVGMLQFLFLHQLPVSLELFRNTYEFEERLRVRMPSGASNPCSPKAPGFTCPPFAAAAAFFGDRRKAEELFTNSWKPYWVEPYGLTKEYQFFPDGSYITGHGSLLMAAMFGFTGLRISENDWRKYPAALPEGWQRIEIDRVWMKGKPMSVIAENGHFAAVRELDP